MCDGGLVVGILGAVVAAAGSGAAIAGQAAAAKRQEKIAKYQAEDIRRNAEIELQRHRNHVLAVLGQQRVQGAGHGFILNAGSNLDIQSDTLSLGEYDALLIKSNAEKEAWAVRTGAREAGFASTYQEVSTGFDAAGGLLTSASDAYGMYRSQHPPESKVIN